MTKIGSNERPLRVAIVGSGPSGFYAAEALFKAEVSVNVDMFERLPVPFGLVRSGVAPDHPKIKNVTRIYEKIAKNEGFRFFGNVDISKDISVEELKKHYDALIFANGAASDRRLNIPGEDFDRSYTATEFVAWYNGHPDYRDCQFDLSQESAVIIGQGNVAVDVCRILAKTVDELKSSDIAQHALDALAESNIKDIYMVGRRGPAQAKFTTKEVKELGELEDTDLIIDSKDLELGPVCQEELELPDMTHNRRNYELLKEFATRSSSGKSRRLHLVFFRSPKAIKGESNSVQEVVLETNQLTGNAGRQGAKGTGEQETLPTGLFFRSVGYRGVEMEGVPFHKSWGIFPNEDGRITVSEEDTTPVNGFYAAGWIKRGPSGVIGTNKPDSYKTVDALIEDIDKLSCENPDSSAVEALLKERNIRAVSFDDWKKIDAAEISRGEDCGKPREKFTSIEEMLAVLEPAVV